MGYRFILDVLEGDAERLLESVRKYVCDHKTDWEPGIDIRPGKKDGEIIIEPQDQRSDSEYPHFMLELLSMAYKDLTSFNFRREAGFFPNPPLHGLFFMRLLQGTLRKVEEEHRLFKQRWHRQSFLRGFEQSPLSDDLLKEMFEFALEIRYVKNWYCPGSCVPARNLEIYINSNAPAEKQDKTLTHEVIEAYGFWVGVGGKWPPDHPSSYTPFRGHHDLVDLLEKELYEFGFHQTIKRIGNLSE